MSDLVLRTVADPVWHPLLDRYRPLFYQRPEWFAHLATAFKGEGLVCCLEEKSGPTAVLPAWLMRAPPLRVVFAGIPYGDVLGPPELRDELLRTISRQRKTIPADQFRFVPFQPSSTLPDCFDRIEERIITELEITAGILTRLPKTVRMSVRKAARLGLTATRSAGEDCGTLLHSFYAETMRRNRASCRYPESWFKSLATAEHAEPKIEVHLAGGEQGAVAMAVFAVSGGTLHVLHGACAPEGLSTGANELLDVAAIERAVAQGAERVDFGASDPEDEGLRAYKRKFGGTERRAPVGVMHLSPVRSRLADLARGLAGTRPGAALLSLIRR